MFYKPLLLPLVIQAALTFVVMFRMYRLRINEFKTKRIHPQTVPSRHKFRQLLTDSAPSADNFSNLFEMPVLFYANILLALILMLQDPVLVALAWLYVFLRVVHSIIHTTYNTVIHRFYVFAASAVVLLGMWVRLGWYIIIH